MTALPAWPTLDGAVRSHAEAALRARRWCKVICGLGMRDPVVVQRLAALYTQAGASALDVAADPHIVTAARRGIADGVDLARAEGRTAVAPLVMVSLGLEGDPHVGTYGVAAVWDGRAADLRAARAAGAECVELHVAGAAVTDVQRAVAAVSDAFGLAAPLSFSIGSGIGSADDVRAHVRLVEALPHVLCILQIEGVPMGGAQTGPPELPSILLAAQLASDIQRSFMQIAGGAGETTRALCRAHGVAVHGVGVGTRAHLAVREALVAMSLHPADPVYQHALAAARALVAACCDADGSAP